MPTQAFRVLKFGLAKCGQIIRCRLAHSVRARRFPLEGFDNQSRLTPSIYADLADDVTICVVEEIKRLIAKRDPTNDSIYFLY